MPTRILIVDDNPTFRTGLRSMLEAHANWVVCGEADSGSEGVQENRSLRPDVIVMDMSMPNMTGIEAATQILKEFPKVPIVLVTLFLTSQLAQEARKAGIRAALSKTNMEDLNGGIDSLLRGEEFLVSKN